MNFFMRFSFVENLLLVGSALTYGFYLIYDVQLIMGGKRHSI